MKTQTEINLNETVPVFNSGTVVSKVKKFGWEVSNEPGEFMMIDKTDLTIDHDYQRNNINKASIKNIRSNWDWISCGCLIVVQRDNKWFVVDGQHRLLAAMERSDIKSLPCLVFDSDSKQRDAVAFYNINKNRKAVSSIDNFKALLTAKNFDAVSLNEYLTTLGFKIGETSSSRTVACISTILFYWKNDKDLFKNMFPVIANIHHGKPIGSDFLKGFFYFIKNIDEKKIDQAIAKLSAFGSDVIYAEMNREQIKQGKGGEVVLSCAFTNISKKRIV